MITTRSPQVADDLGAAVHEVPVLRREAAVRMLSGAGDGARRAVDADRSQAENLADTLGDLPLALHVASRRLSRLVRADGAPGAVRRLGEELARQEERVLALCAAERRPGLEQAEPSLEAVLALSYDALTQDAQRAFCRLAVFGPQPLSFDVAAMQAVWQVDEDAALDRRLTLVDAGLLGREGAPMVASAVADPATRGLPIAGAVRYVLHQVIAAFAAARLAAAGTERGVAALAHARHYASVADAAGNLVVGQGVLAGLAWLDVESPQMRRAVEWATSFATDEAGRALRDLVLPLRNYVTVRSRHRVYGPWLNAALAACRRLGDRSGEANCIQALGDVHRMLDEYEAARGRYEEALPVYREIGARLGEANCIQALGDSALDVGDAERGLALLEQARALHEAIGNGVGLANVGINLARYAAGRGDLPAAIAHLRPAADFAAQIGHPLARQLEAQIEAWRAQLDPGRPRPS